MDVVKAYSKHEKETLFEIIKLRKDMTINEKKEVNEKMDHNFEQIKIIAENYPELRSSENYKQLQEAIVDVEEHLQAAIRMYNSNVFVLNQDIVTFPNNFVDRIKYVAKKDFFEADNIKKEDIKVDL